MIKDQAAFDEFKARQEHLSDLEVVIFAEKHLFNKVERAWFKKQKLTFAQVLVGDYESTDATDKFLGTMFDRWNQELGFDCFGIWV